MLMEDSRLDTDSVEGQSHAVECGLGLVLNQVRQGRNGAQQHWRWQHSTHSIQWNPL